MPKRLVHARACAVLWAQRPCLFSQLSGDVFAKASERLPSAVEKSKAVMMENALATGAMVVLAHDGMRACGLARPQRSVVYVRTKTLPKSGISM